MSPDAHAVPLTRAWSRADTLLAKAAATFDGSEDLARRADVASTRGFGAAGIWVAHALSALRPSDVERHAAWWRWGLAKYGACLAAAFAFVAAAWWTGVWPLGLAALLAFYLVEVQMVFLFPVLADGAPNPLRASRDLLQRSGGTIAAVVTVLRLAFVMLTGGVMGRGFVRSWCLGCLAVVHWYVDLGGVSRLELDP